MNKTSKHHSRGALTLGDLVLAVSSVSRNSNEAAAAVSDLLESGKVRLTKENGTHIINASPDFQYYLDYFSAANTPLTVSLHSGKDGKLIKILEDNAGLKNNVAQYEISPLQFFDFKTSENVSLNGWMIKPANFDQNKKYPVLMCVYGGSGRNGGSGSLGSS